MAALPNLSEDQWTLLNFLGTPGESPVTDSRSGLTGLGWTVAKFRTIVKSNDLKPYVQVDGGWSLTPEGMRIVAARAALLDPDTLADRLKSISSGMKKILDGGLNRRALVVLLQDCTGQSKTTINAVLDGLRDIEKNYCRRT